MDELPVCGNCGSVIEDGEKRYSDSRGIYHTLLPGCLRAMNKRLKELEKNEQ